VEQKKCKNRAHLERELSKIVNEGAEGLMLREPRSCYIGGRQRCLLKAKIFRTQEATVLKSLPGKGALQGRMGALEVKLDTGVVCKVGSGFTDAQRGKPPRKGARILIKYQEATQSGKPRFPVFIDVV
jgi:DNA ligase-1